MKVSLRLSSELFVAAVCLGAPHFSQSVWVVDDDGGVGVDFTSIETAVSSASDGDLVLVRSGTYADTINIQGKGLSIVADEGASVSLTGIDFSLSSTSAGVLVEDLQPTQTVYLRGLNLGGSAYISGYHVLLKDNLGPVWMEDCTIAPSSFGGQDGLNAQNCTSVTVVRCSIDPTYAASCSPGGTQSCGNGLVVSNSSVQLFDSFVSGADGLSGGLGNLGGAGVGVLVQGGSLYASGSSLVGGDGSINNLFCPKGDGVAGLYLAGSGATVRLLESSYVGGVGAPGASDGCVDGLDGPDLVDVGGDLLVALAGSSKRYEVASPIRVGEDVQLSYSGQSGDLVYLGVNAGPGAFGFYLAGLQGSVLTLGMSAPTILFQGTVDTTGSLSVAIPGGPITISGLSDLYVSQPLFVNTSELTVGDPSQLVILDASF